MTWSTVSREELRAIAEAATKRADELVSAGAPDIEAWKADHEANGAWIEARHRGELDHVTRIVEGAPNAEWLAAELRDMIEHRTRRIRELELKRIGLGGPDLNNESSRAETEHRYMFRIDRVARIVENATSSESLVVELRALLEHRLGTIRNLELVIDGVRFERAVAACA